MKRFSLFIMILAIVAVVVAPTQAATGDWPMFHHDLALSGYTTSTAPATNEVLWTYQTGAAVESSPALVGGRVYIGSLDGNLYCLNKYTGALIWSFPADGAIKSSPAVSNGKVYFLSTGGTIYALDADDGIEIWSVPFGSGSYDWSSPAVHDGNVFIASSTGYMYSLDADDGSENWKTLIGGSPDSPITVVNGKVYSGTHNFGTSSPTLVALNETDGSIAWTYDYHSYHSGVVGMINSNGVAVVDGDGDSDLEVYFGVYNWQGVGPQAVCLDEATGNEVWAVSINGNSTSTPAVHNGKVFIGSDDGNLYALDASDGSVIWTYLTGGQVWSAPAVSGDGKVCFGSLDHIIYCLDIEDNGSLIWSYDTGTSRLVSSPAISDGILVIGNENGKVYAFGPECITVSLDIKPGSCPNPLNVKSKGVLPVAVLGTEEFDVTTIDPLTIRLSREGIEEGVAPIRLSYEDVATPFEGELCDCHDLDGDGYMDLTLKFDTQEIVGALGDVDDGDELVLTLTGKTFDGVSIVGEDCILILKKGK